MKKKTIIAIIMSMCMLFAFAACGSVNEEATEESTTDTTVESTEAEQSEEPVEEEVDEEYLSQPDMAVFLAIDYSDASGKEDVEDTMIEMSKEQTVADALQMFADAEGLTLDIDVNGNVKSIDGVEGNWMCEINGEKASDGGMSVPEDGDDVYWIMK